MHVCEFSNDLLCLVASFLPVRDITTWLFRTCKSWNRDEDLENRGRQLVARCVLGRVVEAKSSNPPTINDGGETETRSLETSWFALAQRWYPYYAKYDLPLTLFDGCMNLAPLFQMHWYYEGRPMWYNLDRNTVTIEGSCYKEWPSCVLNMLDSSNTDSDTTITLSAQVFQYNSRFGEDSRRNGDSYVELFFRKPVEERVSREACDKCIRWTLKMDQRAATTKARLWKADISLKTIEQVKASGLLGILHTAESGIRVCHACPHSHSILGKDFVKMLPFRKCLSSPDRINQVLLSHTVTEPKVQRVCQ